MLNFFIHFSALSWIISFAIILLLSFVLNFSIVFLYKYNFKWIKQWEFIIGLIAGIIFFSMGKILINDKYNASSLNYTQTLNNINLLENVWIIFYLLNTLVFGTYIQLWGSAFIIICFTLINWNNKFIYFNIFSWTIFKNNLFINHNYLNTINLLYLLFLFFIFLFAKKWLLIWNIISQNNISIRKIILWLIFIFLSQILFICLGLIMFNINNYKHELHNSIWWNFNIILIVLFLILIIFILHNYFIEQNKYNLKQKYSNQSNTILNYDYAEYEIIKLNKNKNSILGICWTFFFHELPLDNFNNIIQIVIKIIKFYLPNTICYANLNKKIIFYHPIINSKNGYIKSFFSTKEISNILQKLYRITKKLQKRTLYQLLSKITFYGNNFVHLLDIEEILFNSKYSFGYEKFTKHMEVFNEKKYLQKFNSYYKIKNWYKNESLYEEFHNEYYPIYDSFKKIIGYTSAINELNYSLSPKDYQLFNSHFALKQIDNFIHNFINNKNLFIKNGINIKLFENEEETKDLQNTLNFYFNKCNKLNLKIYFLFTTDIFYNNKSLIKEFQKYILKFPNIKIGLWKFSLKNKEFTIINNFNLEILYLNKEIENILFLKKQNFKLFFKLLINYKRLKNFNIIVSSNINKKTRIFNKLKNIWYLNTNNFILLEDFSFNKNLVKNNNLLINSDKKN